MSAAMMAPEDPPVALRTAHAAIDQLLAADHTAASDEALLDRFRELEALRRRLAAVDAALIQEASARRLHETVHVRHLAGLLRLLLRIDPREATGRVRAAEATAPRRALTGERLPPRFPHVAAAQTAGQISAKHAQLITTTLDKLPDEVRTEQGPEIEASLVGRARDWDPDLLAKLTRRLLDCYEPDGAEPAEQLRQRNREFRLTQRADGSSTGSFEATAELTEFLLTIFDAHAAPKPETDGIKDPRTAGQRRHDALLDTLKLAVRSGQLPTINGVTATVVVTMTKQQYETGQGLPRTGHGALVPAMDVFGWAGGDLRLLAVVLSRVERVEAYSNTARLFSENQRLVLTAIDGGCTFPNCSAPPGWCQVHHTIDHAAGGPTDTDHGVLVCPFDHAHRIAQGWTAQRINGRAAWIPPTWIDPHQRPRYNDLHHPERVVETQQDS